MITPNDPTTRPAHNHAFVGLLIVVSLAFGWILLPFYGAVLWAVVIALLFAPLHRWIGTRWPDKPTWSALATLLVVIVIVVLPLIFLSAALVREGAGVYARIQSGELNFARYVASIYAALPNWLTSLLNRFDLGDLGALQQRLTAALSEGSQVIATKLFSIGQDTLDVVVSLFIMLYLAFFLIRDGGSLAQTIRNAIPLEPTDKHRLLDQFATVIRATVKGNVLMAAAQGALGGIAFWFLDIGGALVWGVLMAFLSLLPAIGAGIVWLPVALYFVAIGAVGKGLGLVAYGVLVIGMVDNVLRPVLVGKDTKMPDYMVLVSTLGGIAVFGLNGFVIGPVIAAMFISVWNIFSVARGMGERPL